jgi:hypothetical protein
VDEPVRVLVDDVVWVEGTALVVEGGAAASVVVVAWLPPQALTASAAAARIMVRARGTASTSSRLDVGTHPRR